ncbi:S-adenosylmethionine carrier 1, chloroplastic/mitochondrial [Cajanus cajan]|uniref:S-adenosylmethionine carrier 1, chloroplastic/mitochondrial n=1 Tax=Cajanus cajan TaxID=3821 RepID=UPI00098DD5A5|nr:S-adenosylmethionine carrier 1, chloroplastic/mitochondrial [Cajanus cajan]
MSDEDLALKQQHSCAWRGFRIPTRDCRRLRLGAIGGIVASLIRVPTEVIKQRMQTGQLSSTSGAVRFIASKEGFKGFYAGYGSFLLRDLPFDAIQFCIYKQI